MASSMTGTLSDIGSKVANRVKTVVGDDARELSRRTQEVVRSYGDDYRRLTGQGRSKAKKTAARGGRKPAGRSN